MFDSLNNALSQQWVVCAFLLQQYFPNVQIIATPETVKHIQDTQALKVAYWGPKMGANAPSKIIVPQAYTAKTLKLENESIEIKGQKRVW